MCPCGFGRVFLLQAAGAAAPKLVAPGSGGSLKRMTRVEELQDLPPEVLIRNQAVQIVWTN